MMIVYAKRLASLFREFLKGLLYHFPEFSAGRNLRYVHRWWKSLNPGHSSVVDRSPWLTYEAIDRLDTYVQKGMKVFEYGSGGSTLFFADRAGEVISVEHVKEWFVRVTELLDRGSIRNVRLMHIEPERDPLFDQRSIAEPSHYISSDLNAQGVHFGRYVRSIQEFVDSYFDVVVIDGRARPSCCLHAMAKVRKGGLLVFDNTETPYYHKALRMLDPQDWEVRHYYGCVPFIKHFSQTTIARKREIL